MSKAEMVKPYVEKTLKEWMQADSVIYDDDGDIPIRRNSTMYYVRVIDQDPVMVRIFSPMVRNVKKSAKLFEALNELNKTVFAARIFFDDGAIIIATELLADTLDPTELTTHCTNIGAIADDNDNALVEKFGGEVFFTDDPDKPADEVKV